MQRLSGDFLSWSRVSFFLMLTGNLIVMIFYWFECFEV
ncbi:hypothetical protein C4K13_4661 [Pseudomonas chlororaphis subsp. aureofaciens]|nr:hypothetical protein C4K13_4661 [Pseudomonas chlororaphis subsp. aureofaciens]AZE00377.1 hypothetical protein C4K12_4524 [Pseudomonas chlororaphis subsp. aureofaciens]